MIACPDVSLRRLNACWSTCDGYHITLRLPGTKHLRSSVLDEQQNFPWPELHLSVSNLNATPLRGCLHLRSSLRHQLVAVSTPTQNLKGWDGGILASWWGLPWRWTAHWKRDWGSSCGPWFQTSSSCQAAGRPSRRDQTCRPCPWRAALRLGWCPRWADRGAWSAKKTESDQFLQKTHLGRSWSKFLGASRSENDAFWNHSIFLWHCGKL